MTESKKIETVHKEKKSFNLLHLNPLIKEDRIIAMLIGYTEKIGACPYYKAHCTLKLPSNKKMQENCQGRSFIEGFLCPFLIETIVNFYKKLESHSKPTK